MKNSVGQWIVGDDTGDSSKAIWAHMMGFKSRNGWDHPWDPSDLGRCLRLLEIAPEWKPRLPEMATRSKQWALLVAHWDEIAAMMLDEVGMNWEKAQSAPRTYKLMKDVLGQAF